MVFKKAVELEVLKKDPTEYAQVPKQQKTIEDLEGRNSLPNYLEKGELIQFSQTAKKFGLDQDYSIFLLLAYTGLRAGELCALKWCDIDFLKNTISISKTYYNPTNNRKEYQLLPPKTPSAVSVIDIDDTVINELNKHKVAQKQTMMKYRDIYHNRSFVFASIEEELPGYPLYIKKIENRIKTLVKNCQVKS